MPVYNGEPHLVDAIESILEQSYKNFEFLIIDDGSIDGSSLIINKYQKLDARINSIRHPENMGLIATLNTGLRAVQGKYAARMDQDDISLPDRFLHQVEYLEMCSEVGLLGCKVRQIDDTGRVVSIPPMFEDDLFIRWHIFFHNPFRHPTVMLRKSVLDQSGLQYDPADENAEDFGLWSRLLLHTKGANLPEVLLHYRIHPESMSRRNWNAQRQKAADIACSAVLRHLPDIQLPADQVRQFSYAMLGISSQAKRQRSRLMNVYLKIWSEFQRKHQNESGLSKLRQGAIAWAARMILYPPLQPGSISALRSLTKAEWRWIFFLFIKLPYYFWAHRQLR
jgi:glycosyltransferase involved in cell wall biosynthesis